MNYRQKIEFIIYPHSFQSLKFSYKGEYFFRFNLRQQTTCSYFAMDSCQEYGNSNSKEDHNYAYAYLVRSANSRFQDDKMKGKNYVNDRKEGIFQTKRFKVIFENDSALFDDLGVFNLDGKVERSEWGKKEKKKKEKKEKEKEKKEEQNKKQNKKYKKGRKDKKYKQKEKEQNTTKIQPQTDPKQYTNILTIELVKTGYQIPNNQSQPPKKDKIVFRKELQLNRHHHNYQLSTAQSQSQSQSQTLQEQSEINSFYQLQINDIDHFGHLNLYIGSVWLGERIHRHQYSLCEFVSLSGAQKNKLITESQQGQGKLIRDVMGVRQKKQQKSVTDKSGQQSGLNLSEGDSNSAKHRLGGLSRCYLKENGYYTNVTDYYQSIKMRAQDQFQRVIKNAEQIPYVYSEICSRSSQFFQYCNQLDAGRVEKEKEVTMDYLSEYYGTEEADLLFFRIKQESEEILRNVRYAWQKFQQQILAIDYVMFERLCRKGVAVREMWEQIVRKNIVNFDCQIVEEEREREDLMGGEEGKAMGGVEEGEEEEDELKLGLDSINEKVEKMDKIVMIDRVTEKVVMDGRPPIDRVMMDSNGMPLIDRAKYIRKFLKQRSHYISHIGPIIQNQDWLAPLLFFIRNSKTSPQLAPNPNNKLLSTSHYHPPSLKKYPHTAPQNTTTLFCCCSRSHRSKKKEHEHGKDKKGGYSMDLRPANSDMNGNSRQSKKGHQFKMQIEEKRWGSLLGRSLGQGDDENFFFPEFSYQKSYIDEQELQTHPKPLQKSIVLTVFVHGYNGSHYDLQKASLYLLKSTEHLRSMRNNNQHSQSEILMIKSIQENNSLSINQMAIKASAEVKEYIGRSQFKSINMVGYSLGGIVIRAMMKYLKEYQSMFNLLITFSSPHLGTFSSQNSLVCAGIWFITKFNTAPALEQLHQEKDMNHCSMSFMKALSEGPQLRWFRKLILVTCQEDQFVPHISACAMLGMLGNQDRKTLDKIEDLKRSEILEMSENMRRNTREVENVEICFDLSEKKRSTLDRLTGRTAHIQFLNNDAFLDQFFKNYASQF